MPTFIETGHAKNVANLQGLIAFCESYAAAYSPSKENLQLVNLKKLHIDATKALDAIIEKATAYSAAVATRQNSFANVKQLFTKIVNAFSVTEASAQSIESVKALNKKIQGTRTQKKTNTTASSESGSTPDSKTISTSQQSYDNVVEHLSKIISILSNEPSYKPNETDLQVNSLTELLKTMQDSNKSINIAYAEVSNARIARNELFYDSNTSLYNTAMEVKKYIKSVFGAASPQFKQVSGIKFSNYV